MHQGQVFGIKWIKIVMLSIPLFLLDTSQEHSLPVQVFVNKSGESKEKPASPPVLPQASSPPVMCLTPKKACSCQHLLQQNLQHQARMMRK